MYKACVLLVLITQIYRNARLKKLKVNYIDFAIANSSCYEKMGKSS